MMWHVLGLKMQYCIQNENKKKRSEFFPVFISKAICLRTCGFWVAFSSTLFFYDDL